MLTLEPGELERLTRRVQDGCRCNGHHLEYEPGECAKCGHRGSWAVVV